MMVLVPDRHRHSSTVIMIAAFIAVVFAFEAGRRTGYAAGAKDATRGVLMDLNTLCKGREAR